MIVCGVHTDYQQKKFFSVCHKSFFRRISGEENNVEQTIKTKHYERKL